MENDIIFWTKEAGLPEVEPVKLSKYYIPEWFQKMPGWTEDQEPKTDKGTVKTCPGIVDFFKIGYVVPLWCDLYINIREDGSWNWHTPHERFQFDWHTPGQFKDHLSKEAQQNIEIVLKAYCPWLVRTPKGVSLLQLPMAYHFDTRFTLISGIMWADVQHYINQQLIIHDSGETFIPRGTPLGLYVPIRREKYNLIVREETLKDNEIFNRADLIVQSKFHKGYKDLKKLTNKEAD